MGCGLPVASAVLTEIFPEGYTVMDCHLLETLGYPRQDVHFYEDLLPLFDHVVSAGTAPGQAEVASTPSRSLDRSVPMVRKPMRTQGM